MTPADTVMFSVAVSGSTGIPLYTWRLTGVPVSEGAKYSGVNTPTLIVNSVAEADEGLYSCLIFVDGMLLTSDSAQLTVCKHTYTSAMQCHARGELIHGSLEYIYICICYLMDFMCSLLTHTIYTACCLPIYISIKVSTSEYFLTCTQYCQCYN